MPPHGNRSVYSRYLQHQLQDWAKPCSNAMYRVYHIAVSYEDLWLRPVAESVGLPYWLCHFEAILDIFLKNFWIHWYDPSIHNTAERVLVENFVDDETCERLVELVEEDTEVDMNERVRMALDGEIGPHSPLLQAKHRSVFSFTDLSPPKLNDTRIADMIFGLQNKIHDFLEDRLKLPNVSMHSASLVARFSNRLYQNLTEKVKDGEDISKYLDAFSCPSIVEAFGLCHWWFPMLFQFDSLFSGGLNLHADSHVYKLKDYFAERSSPQSHSYFERTHSALLYLDTEEMLNKFSGAEIMFIDDAVSSNHGWADKIFATFSDLFFGRVKLRPKCGNLILYRGNERNLHAVRPIFGRGHRHSMAIWFTHIPHIDPKLSFRDGRTFQEIAIENRLYKCSNLRPMGDPGCKEVVNNN